MNERQSLIKDLNSVGKTNFRELVFRIFDYQYNKNFLYRQFVNTFKSVEKGEDFRPKKIQEIPFLPIQFFKNFDVKSGENWRAEKIYKSSATTGQIRSKHFVKDNNLYLAYAKRTFEAVYSKLDNFVVFALLPGYIERGDSSLVAMADYFIESTKHNLSGFYLDDIEELIQNIDIAKKTGKKILLLGVSFAIWDLALRNVDLSGVIVMETGGMKGRGPEMPKPAFHEILKNKLNISEVHSEYGMTELLSQGYSKGEGIFKPADTMKVFISEITDPLTFVESGKSGIINVIDLVNIDSCSFIQTEDLGTAFDDGSFQILGRLDNSEIRGCNLLVSDI